MSPVLVNAERFQRALLWVAVAVAGNCLLINLSGAEVKNAESRAIEFLVKEVPAWHRENGCFSCHNNGDAARALYIGKQLGYSIPENSLAGTIEWLRQPRKWGDNKGDPGFSDKRLANVQFATALLIAHQAEKSSDPRALQEAAEKVVGEQDMDGSWPVEPGNALGSPATYGTVLATHLALEVLRQVDLTSAKEAVHKGETFLRRVEPKNVPAAATLLLASASRKDVINKKAVERSLRIIRSAQSQKGGWGPFSDSPPEVFDTALVLLALSRFPEEPDISLLIKKGRGFLISQQNADGSWPATTRPSGGESYAQLMSTTGWALQALFATREF